jgi:hypothetical protein
VFVCELRSQGRHERFFTRAVEEYEVVKGSLSREALFYVQCAHERLEEMASSVTLDYEPTLEIRTSASGTEM